MDNKKIYLSLLEEGRPIYVNARGMSMYPFIKNADRLKIEPIRNERVKSGDIVAVKMRQEQGPLFLAHRVVKITGDNGNRVYFTKGDFHTTCADKPVPFDLIAGKVTEIQRRDISIGLNLPLWQRINSLIAKLSFKYPKILRFLLKFLALIVEWKWLFSKIKRRIRTGSPILYNTESLVLICSRKRLTEELIREAREMIKKGINWQYFCQVAMRGGVTGLVYGSLAELKSYGYIPPFVFDKLKSAYGYILAKTHLRHKELMQVLGVFERNNIPVIPLKGTILSERLYNDIAMRGISCDIDLMIKDEYKERACGALAGEKYYTHYDNKTRQRVWQSNFTKPKATLIDLQIDITKRPGIRQDGSLWEGTITAEKDGIKYFELKDEELLLFLCVHIVSSGCFSELKHICDINELLHKSTGSLDWESVIEKAKKLKVSSSIYAAFKAANEFFGGGAPEWALKKLKPNVLSLMLIKLFANRKVIFRDCFRRRLVNSFLCYIFFDLLEAKSLKQYLSVFRRSSPAKIFRIISRI